jgi:glycosyltransferase involved in cell wall biosynthesis
VTRRAFTATPTLGLLVKVWPKLSETFILEEVLGLERRGVPLRLYALAPPSDEIQHQAVRRVRAPLACVPPLAWHRAGALLRAHASQCLAAPRAWFAGLRAALGRPRGLADFARAGWLAAQMRRDGVAHLHAHFISEPADIAQLAATAAARPFSISAHAKDIYTSRPADLRRRLQAARFTVTCTEHNRRALAAVAPEAPLHRMYHGIDHGLFHPALRRAAGAPAALVTAGEPGTGERARPLLLAVGRLRAKKGLDTLVDACALLHRRGREFRCEIVGYGEQGPALGERIAAAGLAAHVTLPGKLAREDVIARYAEAVAFVQPSRITADGDRDGIPNVLLEAMAMALPVVASAVSGIPELVTDGHNGLLVPPDDAAALADAIERVLDDVSLARRLGEAARTTVTESFDNDRNLQLLARLLEMPHACDAHCAA